MSNRPAILAEGLHKYYGKTHALDGLDLIAEEGSVLAVLGPNGAGKTTAVRILTTLLRPDAGRAEVAGLDVVKEADALRSRIGLAGQYAAVDENLTGYENLEMFGRLYHLSGGVARRRANELLDRFRSLPMAKSAVLTGRTISDMVRNTCVVIVMWTVGLLVGFRPQGHFISWVAAGGILLLTSFAFSWISATIGLVVRSVEAAQSAGFIWLFPLTFASSAFVPTRSMPGWLRTFAEHQPVSLFVNVVRGLLLNQPDAATIWQALAWCVGILVVFIPLAVWAYGHRTAR